MLKLYSRALPSVCSGLTSWPISEASCRLLPRSHYTAFNFALLFSALLALLVRARKHRPATHIICVQMYVQNSKYSQERDRAGGRAQDEGGAGGARLHGARGGRVPVPKGGRRLQVPHPLPRPRASRAVSAPLLHLLNARSLIAELRATHQRRFALLNIEFIFYNQHRFIFSLYHYSVDHH